MDKKIFLPINNAYIIFLEIYNIYAGQQLCGTW